MKSIVNFVGAGPGAEDLITVRGRRLLEEADLVLYAGSLVNPGHLACCKPSCRRLDSAGMDLAAQVDCLSEAAEAGQKVVRLHTGDPAMYGAINEQIRGLAERGIQSVIVPGVSSVFAAAAALGCELTCPDGSQSVVLTRTPGRTPMPASEDAAAFARTGATLAFFLSTGHIAALSARLMKEGGLAPETPAAVAYRASWPDERVLRGSLADIAAQVEAAGIGRQALILVGEALRPHESSSRLYDAQFSHGYRNHLPAEHFDGLCALYAFTAKGLVRAREMAAGLDLPVRIFSTRPLSEEEAAAGIVHLPGDGFDAALRANWRQFAAHVFISATGIAVRKIAPLLEDKSTDPAVLACPESGSHIISLTSGHLGGANRLARRIARHRAVYEYYLEALGRLGFTPFVPRSCACPTVISVNRHPDLSVEALARRLKESYGILIGVGIYQQQGKIWRIGNMAEQARPEKARRLTEALAEIVSGPAQQPAGRTV